MHRLARAFAARLFIRLYLRVMRMPRERVVIFHLPEGFGGAETGRWTARVADLSARGFGPEMPADVYLPSDAAVDGFLAARQTMLSFVPPDRQPGR